MSARDRAKQLLVDAVVVALYVALASAATRFAVLETLSVLYAPAGLAVSVGILRGWRGLPALALGEVLVGLLLFGVASDFGWLVVPNGIAYAAVYVAAGVWLRDRDVTAVSGTPLRSTPRGAWQPVLLVTVPLLLAPLVAATIGMTFQLVAGIATAAEWGSSVLVWWLGDAIGVGTIAVTVMTIAVRGRRGGRWWALPDTNAPLSILLVLSPSLVVWGLTTLSGGPVVFASAVFVPFLGLAVTKGIAGVGLAAPFTSFTMTLVADRSLGEDVLALTDLQLLLLMLLATAIGAALVTEDRDDLQRRLEERSRHLARAQAAARSGSFVWDVPDDTITWSPGLYELYGVPEGPVTADDYLAHVHEDDRDRVAAELGTALADGAHVDHRYRVTRGDGTEVIVRATLDVLVEDGRVTEVTGTCTDVTAEEQARQRLAEAVAREQAARQREAEASAAMTRAERVKDALLVAVSHEVRTPLTIVRGLAETLQREELREETIGSQHVLFDRLDRHSRRLQEVLRDLLDVDRLGRGVVEPVRRPTDLAVLLEEVSGTLDLGDHTLEVDLPPLELELDGRLVARIMEQLLHNAVRHSEPGTPIRVAATADDDVVELRVEDVGPGVANADRDRVFEAFEQSLVTRHSPGTGVGLFLVARFAELHGGRAWVTDRDDAEGASFRVELPAERVQVDT